MPYVIPFVAAIFAWGSMLNPEQGWINGTLAWFGIEGPGLAQRPVVGLPGADRHRPVGHRQRHHHQPRRAPERADRAVRRRARRWRRLVGPAAHVTLPLMSPVIFYSLVLGTVGVLQYFLVPLVLNQGTGRPGGTTYFFNIYIYKTFFTFEDMSYGATLAWFLFVVILVTRSSCSGARGTGSTTPGRRSRWPPRPSSSARRRSRRSTSTTRGARGRAARPRRSFARHLLRGRPAGAFLSPMLRTVTTAFKSTDQITTHRRAALARRSGHVRVRGRGLRRLPRPAARRHDEGARARRPGAPGERVHRSGRSGGRVITWQGSWRALEQPWEFAPQWGTSPRSGRHQLPAPDVQHRSRSP